MWQRVLEFDTHGRGSIEITGAVASAVSEAGVRVGLAHAFIRHTSASLMITENADAGVRRDLETVFSRLAPDGDAAFVHDLEGPDDMAAHVRSVLSGVSLSVPVIDGRLGLGTWQGIFLWEHRTRGHRRQVVVTVL